MVALLKDQYYYMQEGHFQKSFLPMLYSYTSEAQYCRQSKADGVCTLSLFVWELKASLDKPVTSTCNTSKLAVPFQDSWGEICSETHLGYNEACRDLGATRSYILILPLTWAAFGVLSTKLNNKVGNQFMEVPGHFRSEEGHLLSSSLCSPGVRNCFSTRHWTLPWKQNWCWVKPLLTLRKMAAG